MAEVKFRVHHENKEGQRDHLDVMASSPELARAMVIRLRPGHIVVKIKRVRE